MRTMKGMGLAGVAVMTACSEPVTAPSPVRPEATLAGNKQESALFSDMRAIERADTNSRRMQ